MEFIAMETNGGMVDPDEPSVYETITDSNLETCLPGSYDGNGKIQFKFSLPDIADKVYFDVSGDGLLCMAPYLVVAAASNCGLTLYNECWLVHHTYNESLTTCHMQCNCTPMCSNLIVENTYMSWKPDSQRARLCEIQSFGSIDRNVWT